MPLLEPQSIKKGFNKPGLDVITEKKLLEKKLYNIDSNNTNYLFMSSGNYEGLDILKTLSGSVNTQEL
jgi:UDP-N-acetylmuramate: L-alanyl-gamma-D-glutamyl-meso-diaminopimelate ligase